MPKCPDDDASVSKHVGAMIIQQCVLNEVHVFVKLNEVYDAV